MNRCYLVHYSKIEMNSAAAHPHSWFADPIWFKAVRCQNERNVAGLCSARITGVRAMITPPWALHVGKNFTSDSIEVYRHELEDLPASAIVCDLPPGTTCDWPAPWLLQERHTRWLQANDEAVFPELPKHRRKQLRKAEQTGLKISTCLEVKRVLSLHQQARERKSIASNHRTLEPLLQTILNSPYQSSFIVTDSEGNDVANALFLHDADRTIYAFGGQKRSPQSSLATVMLIAEGIKAAQSLGHQIFDFGGSQDSGVDQFYREFGAKKVPRFRAIRVRPLYRWWLNLTRPDLFRSR